MIMAKGRNRRRSSKTVSKQHFPVGELAKRRANLKEKYLSRCKVLKEEKKRLANLHAKAKILKEKADNLEACQSMHTQNSLLLPETREKRKRAFREKAPSIVDERNSQRLTIKPSSACNRKKETLEACSLIHGSSSDDLKPCLDGMWFSFANTVSVNQLDGYLMHSEKSKKVIESIHKKETKSFEKSDENIQRSLNVLYDKGLISKEKYKSIRTTLSMKSINKSVNNKIKVHKTRRSIGSTGQIPKLLSYDKLIAFINSVDTENVRDIKADFCYDLNDDQQVDGAYRDLEEFITLLAEMYIDLEESIDLLDFGKPKYHFNLAIGADGAPFGKDDEATAWLVSFVNVGKRIASPDENFLLCGANCPESHETMFRYAKKVFADVKKVESKTYTILNHSVTFKFVLVPSDMKWLATFSGELSNAAYYFSTFANVNSDNKHKVNGSIGYEENCTWQPWQYTERISVATAVQQKKEELSHSKLAESTKRNKVLEFIRDQKSRQEFKPLMNELVDSAVSEPLHLANNACQQLFSCLLNQAVARSAKMIGSQCVISELSDEIPIKRLLLALKTNCKASRLYKKVVKWFADGRRQQFEYRFTGKETKAFCHYFMYLVDSLKRDCDLPSQELMLTCIAFAALKLRDAISRFNRVMIEPTVISELQECCTLYFNTCSLFLTSVSPSTWTIGYAVPFHTKLLYEKFNVGLGINTMQGREAKHVRLASYAKHTTRSNRWSLVMRHEFISTIWLRKADPIGFHCYKSKEKYIPDLSKPEVCYCGFSKGPDDEQCIYCSSRLYQEVSQSSLHGKLTDYICNLLSVEA